MAKKGKSDKPRFIRRNGKIIPIRAKKGSKSAKGKEANKSPRPKAAPKSKPKEKQTQGFKLIGAGLGLAGLGGILGGGLFAAGTNVKAKNKAATEKNKMIFKAPDLFSDKEISANARRAKSTKRASDKLFRSSLNARRFGVFAGSAAATAGLRKFFDKDRSNAGEIGEEVATAAVFTGLNVVGNLGFSALGKSKKIKALQKFSSTGFTVIRGGKK